MERVKKEGRLHACTARGPGTKHTAGVLGKLLAEPIEPMNRDEQAEECKVQPKFKSARSIIFAECFSRTAASITSAGLECARIVPAVWKAHSAGHCSDQVASYIGCICTARRMHTRDQSALATCAVAARVRSIRPPNA